MTLHRWAAYFKRPISEIRQIPWEDLAEHEAYLIIQHERKEHGS